MNDNLFIFLEAPIDEKLHKETAKIITESTIKNPYGKTIIEAILQDVESLNRNGRVYKKDMMRNLIASDRIQEQLSKKGLKGEAGHPMSAEPGRQTTIKHSNISHKFLDVRLEGQYVIGRIMASGPQGKYFEEDIREGEIPAFSFRGIGCINKVGNVPYADVKIPVTWDRVYYPSHKCAYMTSIVNESTSGVPLNENTMVFNESVLIPISMNESLNKFIKDESKKLKLLGESLEVIPENIIYNESTRTIKVNNTDRSSMIFKLEDYVHEQISGYI